MATPKAELEARIAKLEMKVETLEEKLATDAATVKPWWENIVGAFADDPLYEEAMRLGRAYRESLRPKSPAKPAKRALKQKVG